MYTLTTFRSVPSFAIGYVRDLRVRWALEEAGQAYAVRTIGFEETGEPAFRREQPFGQVPLLQDDKLVLFESGAILAHLGETYPVLMPAAAGERLRVLTWMFAALSSVEPYVAELARLDAFSAHEPWAIAHRPAVEAMARKRLADLDAALEDRLYLAGGFSAADILMASVLRMLDGKAMVESFGRLHAYMARCLARPAFARALADQVALFTPAFAAA